jgi:hypothetical protein
LSHPVRFKSNLRFDDGGQLAVTAFAGVQPMAGAMCPAIVPRIRAL